MRSGWHAFWTVEHHFLQEYSHCSNPEVLYGAIASRTENIRLGYGVRLMPKPYNHPVRTAESWPCSTCSRRGASTWAPDVGHPGRARGLRHRSGREPPDVAGGYRAHRGLLDQRRVRVRGRVLADAQRRVQPKPWQKPHPPLWGATTTDDGHGQVGGLGLGLCSFAVGLPPTEVKRKIDVYRAAVEQCTAPIGAFVNNQAATFTMALCGPDREKAKEEARESFEWYPKTGARQIATLTDWMAERKQDLGNYSYAADMKKTDDEGTLDLLSLEYLVDANACVLGTPEQCLEACRAYEAAGVDLLLCLVNPYKISHEAVMQTIELMGTEVIPHFDS